MFFSSIADAFPQALNLLYRTRDAMQQRGESVLDLISGNVSRSGIVFPESLLRDALHAALPAARIYQPDSFGQPVARQAISEYYQEAGLSLPPEQIVLSPGTSISYLYCFKLLAESGDEILCPSPSYPLFETIAQLCNVRLTSYLLRESRNWEIDLDYLESQITTRTRAIVIISPHNPTGAVADWSQLRDLAGIAARHRLAVIADEVFSEFLFGLGQLPRPAQTEAPLVFTLNGFSKMLALPGLKLGWIGVTGEAALVRKSMRTLEMMSDTFLPVNELVQFAVPTLLRGARPFMEDYRSRVAGCRELAVKVLSHARNLSLVPPAGGFCASVRWTGAERDEEQWLIDLLKKGKILAHPGYFYAMSGTHLVMTFVEELEVLAWAMGELVALADG
ncbi:MAG: pyridoxal phosphate-dependent aminotransferase [Acidobacteria bacterium]|nr:pyridoxal phosphate-dependent aminotransferase [Acidobacteriota bacterium]